MDRTRILLSIWLCCVAALDAVAQQPLSLGFEAGVVGELPQPWFVPPVLRGWRAELVDGGARTGGRCLRVAPSEDGAATMGNVMCSVPAAPLRGRRVRLSAWIAVAGEGRAQLWLRVDRAGGSPGAIDDSVDRPVLAGGWQEATVEVDVAADAEGLALGVLVFGESSARIDDVALSVVGDARPMQVPDGAAPLSEREQRNAAAAARLLGYLWFFHPSDALVGLGDWHHFVVALLDASLDARDDTELAAHLGAFVAPFAPAVQVWAGSPEAAPPQEDPPGDATHRRHWEHRGAGRVATVGNVYSSRVVKRRMRRPVPEEDRAAVGHVVRLSPGVHARVPLLVWATREHALPPSSAPEGWAERERVVLSAENRVTRLAAVAQAWAVFQHFYPYFDVVPVDWDEALQRALADAARLDDGGTEALERLVAALRDGHGYVAGGTPAALTNGFLPLAVRWAGEQPVVAAAAPGVDGVRVGDVLVAIDGRPAADVLGRLCERIASATVGYARHRAQDAFALLETRDPVALSVRRVDGASITVEVPRSRQFVRAHEPARPANGADLVSGIVYFDLCGASKAVLDEAMPALRAAEGIVFDLRGYPDAAAMDVLGHLLTEPGTSARFGVPVVTRPDRDGWRWDEAGSWRLRPLAPRLAAEVAFLTDGRAISYAESVLGVVEAYRLGEIVGARTAGTNGNVNPFVVATGHRIHWTGMRVLKHDGSTHHGVGIAPTVPVEPTPAGIAAGRDEVLERAVEVLRAKLAR